MRRFSILDIEDAKQFVGTFVKFGYCLDDLDNSEYGLLIDVKVCIVLIGFLLVIVL